MMILMKIYWLFVMLICARAAGAEPVVSPTPTASASPAVTITQSVTELSAQRAAAERSKIYHAGAAYGRWLDQPECVCSVVPLRSRSCHCSPVGLFGSSGGALAKFNRRNTSPGWH